MRFVKVNAQTLCLLLAVATALTFSLKPQVIVCFSSPAPAVEKSDAQTLIFALDNYKDIYNRYPPASPQGEAAKCNARLLRILMGHDGDENPKRIAFIGIHEEKNKLLDYVLKMTGLRPLRELDQPLFITEAGKHGKFHFGGIERKTGLFVDRWGTPYSIQITGVEIEVRSAGRNRIFGDVDDWVIYEPPRP